MSPIGGGEARELSDFETRKVWALVTKGIRKGDLETARRSHGLRSVPSLFALLPN